MEIKSIWIITLTEKEASALKVIVGDRSKASDLDHGLTNEDSTMLTELYDLLPYREDEEE